VPPDRPLASRIARAQLQERLPAFLRAQRWFGGKAQSIRDVEVVDIVPFALPAPAASFVLVQVRYHDATGDTYFVPLVQGPGGGNATPSLELPGDGEGPIVLYDATSSPAFLGGLLASLREGRTLRGQAGELRMTPGAMLDELAAPSAPPLSPRLMRVEQSNSSVVYGDRLILKLFRRLDHGINPDLEIGRFLTENTGFRNLPLIAGYLEYRGDGPAMTLGILQNFVPNQGDAWGFTLPQVRRYFERVGAAALAPAPSLPAGSLWTLAGQAVPADWRERVGPYLRSAALLGRRTAELHLALSTPTGNPQFAPEPYSPADQRAFADRALDLLHRNLGLLARQAAALPADVRRQAGAVLDRASGLQRRFQALEGRPLTALRTRIHGDYHLGQVLVSGDDFFIIDFEGEPARPLPERRRKQSPVQDVAGMLRSFHYAAYAPLLGDVPGGAPLSFDTFDRWAYAWQMWVSLEFLRAYLATAGAAAFLPRDPAETALLLDLHLLEKAVYELGYELNNRPSWVRIPLSGIAQLAA